jgi:hypothetical protein
LELKKQHVVKTVIKFKQPALPIPSVKHFTPGGKKGTALPLVNLRFSPNVEVVKYEHKIV